MDIIKKLQEALIQQVSQEATLVETDIGDFKTMKKNGFVFHVSKYEINELGSLSTMRGSAVGLMNILTFTITPGVKDMPMLSIDVVNVGGTRKSYIEFYNMSGNENQYENLANQLKSLDKSFNQFEAMKNKSFWYEDLLMAETKYLKTKKSKDTKLTEYIGKILEVYIASADQAKEADEVAKENLYEYVETLLSKGGPSTDVFIKLFGESVTREFYHGVVFGTKNIYSKKEK